MAKKVVIYSSPTCPHCIAAKEFLKEKGVEFEDKNVSEDEAAAKEAVDKSGQMGVPVIEIGGEIVIGNNQEKIEELLK